MVLVDPEGNEFCIVRSDKRWCCSGAHAMVAVDGSWRAATALPMVSRVVMTVECVPGEGAFVSSPRIATIKTHGST